MRKACSLFVGGCLAAFYISCGGDPKPADSGDSAGSVETAETGGALDCEEDLIPAVDWFDSESTESWTGDFEFGQTHVIAAEETRLAPPVIAERETLVLFTPTSAVSEKADVRLTAQPLACGGTTTPTARTRSRCRSKTTRRANQRS